MLTSTSGQQFVLQRGEATAWIGQVAAVLREFSIAGRHYTEVWPDDQPTPMGCVSRWVSTPGPRTST